MNKKLTDESNPLISYISGAFDVGGCVRIETLMKGKPACLYIWITSKHFALMEKLQSLGAHVTKRPDGQFRAKWREHRALMILHSMLPYLVVRKDQAICGIEFFNSKKQGDPQFDENIYRLRLKLCKADEEGGS